tara:strand:- start:79 stop:1263 length:1185 start_codon:yes stop_codon:yes gene_type:complete
MENLIYIFLTIIIFELILIITIKILKKNFKWLINAEDEMPNYSKENLKKFYKDSFDPTTGWDRKKNKVGFESGDKKTFFRISKNGYRGDNRFKKTAVSVFGDSFAFCRYVNDDETWESYLEDEIKMNINNYGVGNFGLDQSYLKFRKYKKNIKSKIIIFNIVPETIARINSYWKHYREFGNILGFKPVYEFKENKLILKKNPLKKNFTQKQIHSIIPKIKKIDGFYTRKFLKNKFTFPYFIVLFKNFYLYSNIIFNLVLAQVTNRRNFYNNAVSIILKKNIKESHKMYNNPHYIDKLKSLIFYLNNNLKKNNFCMILVISPQLLDLTDGKYENVSKFYEQIKKKIPCIDLYKKIKKKKFKEYYFKDIYGGHFNAKGNKLVAKILFNYLKKEKFL